MEIGPVTRVQQESLKSAGFPSSVFCSFFEGGLRFDIPSSTLTAQVPQIPAPPLYKKLIKILAE